MIKSKNQKPTSPIEVDLTGPEGNAFVLIGYGGKWAKQLGLDSNAIQKDMMSGDYEHLLSVLEKHFGNHIVMYR